MQIVVKITMVKELPFHSTKHRNNKSKTANNLKVLIVAKYANFDSCVKSDAWRKTKDETMWDKVVDIV